MNRRHLTLVCTSDLHLQTPEIPDGDVLIVAGDLTCDGSHYELVHMGDWLRSLPHGHKIVVAGNHDYGLETEEGRAALGPGIHYLEDETIKIGGWNFFGSPKNRCEGWAFFSADGPEVPEGADILITHQPPAGIGDGDGMHSGYHSLKMQVRALEPRFHIFGHAHRGAGVYSPFGFETTFLNVAYRRLRQIWRVRL